MNNLLNLTLTYVLICCVNQLFAQGPTPQYPGPGTSVGFATACPSPSGSDGVGSTGTGGPITADALGGAAGTSCNGGADFTVDVGAMFDNGATGFDVPVNLTNFQVDETAAYDLQITWFPSNNNNCGCGVCLDAQIDLGQATACGYFGSQADLGVFGLPAGPLNWGADVLGVPALIEYGDLCPNTQYDVFTAFTMNTSNADVFDPADDPANPNPADGDGDGCALDFDEIVSTNAALYFPIEGPFSIIGPGDRSPIELLSQTITIAAGSTCTDADVIYDVTADIDAGCFVETFGAKCSMGLELEVRLVEACAGLDISTGPLIADPTGCFTGVGFTGQIAISGADVCAALDCNAGAVFEIYAFHTFCEASDINGDGTGIDEIIGTIDLSTAFGDPAACCAPAVCTVDLTAPAAATGCDPNDGVGFAAPLDLATCSGADGPAPTGQVFDVYIYAPGGAPATAPMGYENTPIPSPAEFPDPFGDGNLAAVATDITCADAIGDIGLSNPTCDPFTFTFIYVPFDYTLDTDGDLVAEYPQDCQPVRVDYTVNPTLTAVIQSDASGTCGDVVAILQDAAVPPNDCAGTEMTVSCAALGNGAATDITLTDNGCGPYTIAGGACANCAGNPPCDLMAGEPTPPNDDVCLAGTEQPGDVVQGVIIDVIGVFGPPTTAQGNFTVVQDYVIADPVTGEIISVTSDAMLDLTGLAVGEQACISSFAYYLEVLELVGEFLEDQLCNTLCIPDPLDPLGPELCPGDLLPTFSCGDMLTDFADLLDLLNQLNNAQGLANVTFDDVVMLCETQVLTINVGDIVGVPGTPDVDLDLTLIPGLMTDGFCCDFSNQPHCLTVVDCSDIQPPVCMISNVGLSASVCTNPNATDDPADDTFVLTINPTGTDIGTTFTYDIGAGPVPANAYGTPITITLPADGASITVTITDDTDTTCTLVANINAPTECSTVPPVTDIPTLSQWGLITLMLMLMSYGAIAMSNSGVLSATLRRKEEE